MRTAPACAHGRTGNRHGKSACRSEPEHGFILVSVIFILAAMSLLAMYFLSAVRLEVKTVANREHATAAQLHADGIARYVSLRLADPKFLQPGAVAALKVALKLNGAPFVCRFEHSTITLAVNDVGGLIDINSAAAPMLKQVFIVAGATEELAARLAVRVVDFRDPDDRPLGDEGAENEAYAKAGLAYGPKNMPFEDVAELDQILDMPFDLYRRVAPMITVHSKWPRADVLTAPPNVLKVVRGERQDPRFAETDERAGRRRANARVFRISVWAEYGGGTEAGRLTTIEVRPEAPNGFRVLSWEQQGWQWLRFPDTLALRGEVGDAGACLAVLAE